ncbi:class D sortase [Alkalicoccus daliensis]|uniref:Sortase A n=1 Tax=Alkalicoccus daliensis TaxID=745820 RepID=A0A1H0HGD8_9BACI|nr:class D sortase [Alkalicoccus daliensis]SDO18276.1 sortase A [Alkalicoccus daliensis]
MKLVKSRKFLLVAAILLLSGGLWFSTTNAYTFAKGYMLYKTGSAETISFLAAPEKTASGRMLGQLPAIEETAAASALETTEGPDAPLYSAQPEKGDLIGELSIPKLDAVLPIYHGTEEEELELGVGHYAGSVLPGLPDNSVLSGHRDTVFRELGEVGENDLLIVTTAAGEFEYKVKRVRIVDKEDRTVIVPKPKATLTVSTCYPFSYVGNAPDRYVLVAELKSQKLF